MHSTPSTVARVLTAAASATIAMLLAVATPTNASPESVTRDSPRSSADAAGDPTRITCPIPSGSEFIDSWGAARSGGRRHKGVDMVADRGEPIVAVQAGEATFKRSRLGGNAVWLTTETGNKFYYAHLDSFEGSSRTVAAGEVIGYVGSSGNAKGPHLHFETHFDGSVGNPYDATHDACVTSDDAPNVALRRGNVGSTALVPFGRLL